MPTRQRRQRLHRLAACAAAALAAAPPVARAVIFQSTGDPTFNTTAPTTGTYAHSGWQYQIQIGSVLGTAVGPHHFITAAHVGGTGQFNYNGELFTPTLVQDYGDLRLLSVDKTFYSYAPLYALSDGDEVGKELVVIGRGTQRGSARIVDGNPKGWNWGTIDAVQRWGTNVVASTTTPYGSGYFRYDFNLGASVNEAVVSNNDSGGGNFISVNGQWKFAGATAGVTGPYSDPPDATQFVAALYDTTGLLYHEFVPAGAPGIGPSGSYTNRVAPSTASIEPQLNLPPTWNARFGGTWGTNANWTNTGAAPNAVDATADFRTVIDANQNVTFNGNITVGTLEFDNLGASYAIVPGMPSSSQLHLDVSSGQARVNVAGGTHSVSSVYLDDPTTFHIINPNAQITLNAFNAQGQAITKTGAGTLQVNRLLSGAVTVSQGTIKVVPGSSTGTGRATGVSVTTGASAKLDLTTTDLIVAGTPVGTKVGSAYTGLQGLIQQGSADGAWNAPGITSSSAAAAGGLTALGIARAGDVLDFSGGGTQLWSGQTVSANDALIAYTYAGDANLDGFISGDDYASIDGNITVPGASGWYNGDFNYDGIISGDDYAAIDSNIVAQGAPLITSGVASLSGVSAVPEPASLSLVAIASAAMFSRRRRR